MNKRLIALFGALMMLPVGVPEASAVNTDKSIMQNDYLTLYVDQDSDPGRCQQIRVIWIFREMTVRI